MTRRNISLNFRRRILATISSLFQRRWVAPVRSTRRSRWSQRIREFARDVGVGVETTARAAQAQLGSLTHPEFLEGRQMMAAVNVASGTTGQLAVWFENDNDQVQLRSVAGSGLLQVSADNFATFLYDGTSSLKNPSGLVMYDQETVDLQTYSMANIQHTNGVYTNTVPSVSVDPSKTYGTPATAQAFMKVLGVTITGGKNFAVGDTLTLTSLANPSQTVDLTVLTVGTGGTIATTSVLLSTTRHPSLAPSNFRATSSSNPAASFTGLNTPSITAVQGEVDSFDTLTSGSGYFDTPGVTFSAAGAGGTTAVYVWDLNTTGKNFSNTGVAIRPFTNSPGATPITQALTIGFGDNFDSRDWLGRNIGDVESVTIAAPVAATGDIVIRDVVKYTQTSSVSANGAISITSYDYNSNPSVSIADSLTATGSSGSVSVSQSTRMFSQAALDPNAEVGYTDLTYSTVYFTKFPGYPTGTSVKVTSSGGGLTAGTTYYIRSSAGGYSFHSSAAGATGNFGRVTLTSMITGRVYAQDATGNQYQFALDPNYATGTAVKVAANSGGLTAGTTYYVQNLGTGLYSFHNTSGDAIGDINRVTLTGPIREKVFATNFIKLFDYTKGPWSYPGYNINVVNPGYADGTRLRISANTSASSSVSGLSPWTDYFVRNTGVNEIALYDTRAHALAGGATGLQTITGALPFTESIFAVGDMQTSVLLTANTTASVSTDVGDLVMSSSDVTARNGVAISATNGSINFSAASARGISVSGTTAPITLNASRNATIRGDVLQGKAGVDVRARYQNVSLDIPVVSTGASSPNNFVYVSAGNTIDVLRTVSSNSWLLMQATTGSINVAQSVSAVGDIQLLAGENITGVSTVSGANLTLAAGSTSGSLSLTTSVDRVAASAGGSISITNTRSLITENVIVGTGGAASSLTLATTGATSDLTIGSALTTGVNTTVNLSAGRDLTALAGRQITAANDVSLSAGNAISLTAIATTGRLVANAANGIDLSGTASAANFTLTTNSGGIRLSAQPVNGNTVISDAIATSGAVVLASQSGNLVVNNQVLSGDSNVSLQTATGGNIDLGASANISTPTTRAVVLSAGGTLVSNPAALLTTGTLNVTAQNISGGLLSSTGASYHTLNAVLTGTNLALNVARTGNLNVTGAATANGCLTITTANGVLNVSGPVSAVSNDVTLGVVNGSLNLAGTINAGSTGTVNLSATVGGITATQTITAKTVTANAAGNLTISGAINGASTGSVALTSGQNLNVSGAIVAGSGGLSAVAQNNADFSGSLNAGTTGNVNLSSTAGYLSTTQTIRGANVSANAAGNLTIAGQINGAAGSLINLTSGQFLNVTNAIIGGSLTTNSSGPQNIAATVTATGTVTLRSSNTLTVSQAVVAGNLTTDSVGVQNLAGTVNLANGTATLNSASTLLIGQPVRAGKLDATSTGNLTVSGSLNIGTGDAKLTSRGGSLTVSNSVLAGNFTATSNGSQTLSNTISVGSGAIALNAVNGAISATNLLTGSSLDVRARDTSTITTANVSTLTGGITGSGQNLTAAFGNSIAIGAANLTANGGTLDLTLSAGNLTRTGAINTVGGGVAINVGANQIQGTGTINTSLLQWTANAAPNATGLTYSVLTANQTGVGDLVISRPASLEIRGASIANGAIDLSVTSGNLTINGAVESRASITNITLAAPGGSIKLGSSVANITANVLNVTAQNDVTLATDVTTLIGNVTNGAFTVTERNGLIIGGSGVRASTDNVTITVLAGDLDRSNPITAGAGKTLTLNVPNGNIIGSAPVNVAGGTLIWSANAAPADGNLTGDGDYSFLSANVTGNGQPLTISRTGNLTILQAATANGIVSLSVTNPTSDLTINGPVTAGGGNAAYLSAGNRIVVTGTNLVTAGYLCATAYNDSTLRINATTFEGDFDQSKLAVVATGPLGIGANGVTTTGAIDLSVTSGNLSLTGGLNAGTGSNVAINVAAGGISGTGQITANAVNVTSASSASLVTNATTLAANVTGGNLVVSEVDDLDVNLAVGSVKAANSIAITVGGDLDGNGLVVAGQNITLNASSGNVTLSSSTNQVSAGNLLTLRANGTSAVNTAVGSVTANILNNGATLTIVEGDGLTVDAAGIRANGIVSIQAADLVVTGAVNAGTADMAIKLSGGSSGNGLVSGTILTFNAVTNSSLNTAVSNLIADVTGGSLSIVESNALTIDGVNAATSVSIKAGGAIDGSGNVVAGNGITLNATAGGIVLNGAQQVRSTGNGLLAVYAANSVDLNVSVGSLTANVTGGNLTVADNGTLAVNAANVAATGLVSLGVASGDLTLDGRVSGAAGVDLSAAAGSIIGTGSVSSTNNVMLNAADAVTLSGAGQVAANVLTVFAVNSSVLGTNVNSLDAVLADSAAILEVTETNGLAIIAADAPGGVNLTVTGTLNGTGLVNSGSNGTRLNVTGSINLASAGAVQVIASDLDLVATASANLNVAIATLNASVTGGSLKLTDTNDLTIDGEVNVPNGNVALAVDGAINGSGLINSSQTVSLTADSITLTEPAQVMASVLQLVVAKNADVNIDVQNLVANVGQALNVVEAANLFIGVVPGDEVRADSVDITVKNGNLAGPGNVVATNSVNLLLQDSSSGSINLTTGRVSADNLTATVQQGSIDLNTAVSNLTATTFQNLGHIVVGQTGDLTVQTIDTVDGNVKVSVASGNLTIGSGVGNQGILGGQLSDITLSAANGFIVTNQAVVFGNALNVTAQNSSTLNTTVTSLVANITGRGESLTVFEEEEVAANSAASVNGLQIGLAGVLTRGGDVSITLVHDTANNITGGDLVVTGPINTRSGGNVGNIFLDVANGSVTGSGLISGGFLNVSAKNTSSLNTSVDTLSANIASGRLTVSEQNGVAIDATNGVIAQNVSLNITGAGSLNVAGDIVATSGDLSIGTFNGNIAGTANVSSPANVTLVANGSVMLDSSVNQVTGNVLDVNATGGASLTTAVTSLSGNVTGDFTVVEANNLSVAARGIALTLGDLSLELTTGSLTGAGGINVNGGDVTLNASAGSVTLTAANQVAATGNLVLLAQNTSAVNTSVAGLAANVTSGTLTVVEATGLTVLSNEVVADNVSLTLTGAGNLVLNGDVTSDVGDITIVVRNGSVSGAGLVNSNANVAINASNAVTLSAANQVTGNVLNLVAGSSSRLGTDVTSLFANVSGGTLVVNENDDLTILAAGAANGVGATNVTVTAGGDLTLAGNVTARTGDLSLTATAGNISGAGIVNAARNVLLSAVAGNVTLNGINQVRGQLLTVNAQDDSAVNTVVGSLAANVTSGSLTVFEANDLLIANAGVVAADNASVRIAAGNLTGGAVYSGGGITAGDTVALVVNGTVDVYGPVYAGDPGFQGAITAQTLTIQSKDATIDTDVTTLVANVTGSLEVDEETGLTIGSNVNATGNISLSAVGLIDGTGLVRSSTGNVTLKSVSNAIVLDSSAGQVAGNVLSVVAALASSIKTNVTTLVANLTGSNESLTINEVSGLIIGSANVVTNDGDIDITVGGNLVRTGAINADSGNVTLTAATGGITGSGLITGNVLDVAAQNSTSLNTTVNTLNVALTGNRESLTVVETNSLTIDPGLTTINGAIAVTVGGDLLGPGDINAGSANVTLTAATGDVDVTGTITGNVLTLTAESANVTTNITAINATTTAGGLQLSEANALQIDGLKIAGDVNLTIGGDITGTGVISANNGVSNVALVSAGGISLTAANQIVGNVLNVTAVNTSSLGTKVNTLVANITGSSQSLTVVEADGLAIGSAKVLTTNGNVSITSGSLNLVGGIDTLGGGNVSLNANGTVSGSGLIVADRLNLNSTGNATVTTDINLLNASVVNGRLVVSEADDLTIVSAAASGDITLNAVAGTINGTGVVNSTSGNVSLAAIDVTLTGVNQVRGNVLSVNVSDAAVINTAVNTLTASNVGTSLDIVEADGLTIGAAGITGVNAAVNLVTGGSLTFTGGINVTPAGTVNLNVGGAISGSGQIKADTLNAVASASSTLNTSINNLSARVTSPGQSLTITEADSLKITGDSVTTTNGPISLTLATGNLTVDGVLSAGSGTFATVDINVANGRVNTTASGSINGTSLNLRAQNSSSITTNVGTITANITGNNQGLAVTEFDALTIGAGGIRANNGAISLRVGDQAQGSLLLSGPVNAGVGNVSLDVNLAISGTGLVTGNVLDVTVARTATLNTQVNAVQGALGGTSQTLTITEADGINIGGTNLSALGTNSRIVITANGGIGGTGSIIANSGTSNIALNATNGGINITGKLDSGNQGTVVLLSSDTVTMGSPRQIIADTLVLNSAGSATVGTDIAKLSAVVRNANATLSVSDYDGLQILSNTAITNNGAIAITAGTGAAGSLVIAGPVNAVLNSVTLTSQNGGISTTGNGLVTGGNLFITSLGNVALATNVAGLAAKVSGPGNTITINETNDLTIINSGNVVQTTNGSIAITLAKGNLSGPGVINAGTGSVTLNVDNGSISLTSANQVRAGLLTATANGSSLMNTAVDNLNVTLRGEGSTLAITEANNVAIDRVSTANGTVSIRSLTGALNGSGNLSAGTADVTLNAATAINISGRITANNLSLNASLGDAAVNTTVNGITAIANGSIVVNETDALTLLPSGLNAATNVTVNAGGTINGTGNVVASSTVGQIILNAAGGTTLATRAGQVRGDSLLVAGGGVSTINTTVNNLAATLNGSLTVNETSGLAIDPDLNTSIANGNVTLNVLQGNLALTSNIAAGTGTVTLNVANGSIGGSGRIAATQLTATARTGINVNTDVDTLNATVSSTGNLTVNEANNLTVLTASTTSGNISLTAGGDIETRTVTGKAAPLGNVAFTTAGNVSINGPLTTNVLNLSGVGGDVTVLAAGSITTSRTPGSVVNQPTGNGVIWQVSNNGDSGAGTLRTAITNINSFQGRSQLILANQAITLSSQLPTVSREIHLSGNGNVTIQGSAGNKFSGLTLSATNSSVDGIKLANFGAPALYLIGGRTSAVDIDVSNVTIDNSQIGIQAVNLLSGSTITRSTVGFSTLASAYRTNSYGIMLSAAQGLAVGGTTVTGFGSGNGGVTVSNVAIGIAATGVSTGSAVRNADISSVRNTIGSGYGLSLASATGLTITASRVSNSTTGLFASGFCTMSTVSAMTFSSVGTNYSVRNSRNLIITN